MEMRVRDDLVGCVSRLLGGLNDWLRRMPFLEPAAEEPAAEVVVGRSSGGAGEGRTPFWRVVAARSAGAIVAVHAARAPLGAEGGYLLSTLGVGGCGPGHL